jgi:uncharacterized protein (TIGR00369 family)
MLYIVPATIVFTIKKDVLMTPDQVLASWREQEVAVRANLLAPGVAPREQVFGMTGMEVFEAIFAGKLPPAPIGDLLDFIPVHMGPGLAIFQGKPQQRHYNPLGTVHGGWFCTLLDSAVGCAVHTTLPGGKGYTTLELKVNMLRPLTDAVPLVHAEGKVIHALCARHDNLHDL